LQTTREKDQEKALGGRLHTIEERRKKRHCRMLCRESKMKAEVLKHVSYTHANPKPIFLGILILYIFTLY
jgi:hypothetical protein